MYMYRVHAVSSSVWVTERRVMATSESSRRRREMTTTSKTTKSGSREQVSHGSIWPLASSNLLMSLRFDEYMYLNSLRCWVVHDIQLPAWNNYDIMAISRILCECYVISGLFFAAELDLPSETGSIGRRKLLVLQLCMYMYVASSPWQATRSVLVYILCW